MLVFEENGINVDGRFQLRCDGPSRIDGVYLDVQCVQLGLWKYFIPRLPQTEHLFTDSFVHRFEHSAEHVHDNLAEQQLVLLANVLNDRIN